MVIMSTETTIEQRSEARTAICWPVSIWIPEANRFFHGQSCNVSKTGVFLTLPVTSPVREDNIVEINFPRTEDLARKKGQFARIKKGKIVRIDRGNLLKDGKIGVGIAFE